MNGFLIDTNVISEILRTAPDVNVAAWARRQAKQVLFLSVVSMGELRKGVTICRQAPAAPSWRNRLKSRFPSGSVAAYFQ